jgi:hypothetical protein
MVKLQISTKVMMGIDSAMLAAATVSLCWQKGNRYGLR